MKMSNEINCKLSDDEMKMLDKMTKQLCISQEDVLQQAVVFFCKEGVKHPAAKVSKVLR